ncbi:3-methyladenine DNA glycosylase [Nakamurella sp. A5-74]|uniref:3-methyladenine DNA glycosylase n=1 Tax=Nakamurella sp. A5-74 TaxID=3158264 RepID=A0AAU8DRV2_9ACTN
MTGHAVRTGSVAPTAVLERTDWERRKAEHATAVDELTAGHRARASTGRRHPVEDFLHTYYSLRPSQLRRWHPGLGVGLLDAGERAEWRFHRTEARVTTVDAAAMVQAHDDQIRFVAQLLRASGERPAQFGCFGLHEWAMVYRADPDDIRHGGIPLRLGSAGTDAVVEQHPVKCSHYDAFRFFTPAARGRNLLQLSLSERVATEQPGCLHVGMDLYKWAYKLLPAVSGELLLDCYRLARRIREVDMRASPYDLSALDLVPIAIETPEGKAEYVARQREFAAEGAPLRDRVRAVAEQLLAT